MRQPGGHGALRTAGRHGWRFVSCCLCAGAFACLWACAPMGTPTGTGNLSDAYTEILKKWTRQSRVYRGLETGILVTATYRCAPFRLAYAEEYARAYRLDGQERARLFRDQEKAAGEFRDFVVAVFVPEEKWNDLEKKKSVWRIYLVSETGQRTAPLEVRAYPRKEGTIRHFYPYCNPWKRVYAVRFPPAPSGGGQEGLVFGDGGIKLVVTGVLGTAEMVWST